MAERSAPTPAPGASGSHLPARFARNAASNYALTGVLLVVALVTTPILTHHLGPERFGIWTFVGSAITYVQLLDLGFGGAVVSAVARLSARGDDDELERALNTSFFLLLALGAVALALCAVAAVFLPAAMHLHGSLVGTTRDLFLLLGLDAALSIPMDTFGCGLVALQRYDLLNATLVAVAVGQTVAWTLVLVSGGGLVLLGVMTVSLSLVGQVVRYVLLRRLLPGLSISPSRVRRSQMRSLASPAGWYALGDLISNFLDQASVLILGLVQSVTSAGIFAVADKLATLGTQMGTPVVQPFFPYAATLVAQGDDAELAETTRTGTRVTAGATIPFCLIVGVLARPALLAWVGPTYLRAAPAVIILAVAFGLRSFCSAPLVLLGGAGGQRLIALLGVVKISLQVLLTAVLGLEFGITGVAWAVLASVVAVDVTLTLPLVTRRLGTRTVHAVVPVLRSHAPAFVAAGALGWYLGHGPVLGFAQRHARWADLLVVAGAGLAVLLLYTVLYVAVGVDRRTRRAAASRMRHAPLEAIMTLFSAGGLGTEPPGRHDQDGPDRGAVPLDGAGSSPPPAAVGERVRTELPAPG